MRLTKIERNKIYEAIARSGADLNEFDFQQRPAEVVITHSPGSTLRFREESYGGSFAFVAASYQAYMVSAKVKDGRILRQGIEETFDRLLAVIERWADEVARTVEAPDLWAEMQSRKEFIEDIQRADSGNAHFTEYEQRQIGTLLQEIRQQIREQFELTSEQIADLGEKFDEATEASTRMGRKDWIIYFLGTITTLIITATVVGGVGEQIMTMVIHGLGHLFPGGNEPPQIVT
jgi:hypothetical protein